MGFWRNACSGCFAGNEGSFLQLSRAKGLRDEKYMYCWNQIKLQECLDFGLHYSKQFKKIDDLLRSELIRLPSKHDSVIRNLMDTESVVPKKFKDALHPDLIRLSVEVFVKSYSKEKQQEQAYMQLQSLEDARRRRETSDVDKMLIDFLSEFPCISDFSKEGFPVTPPLLYIKHLVYEIEPAASWRTEYFQRRMIYKIEPDLICHKHWCINMLWMWNSALTDGWMDSNRVRMGGTVHSTLPCHFESPSDSSNIGLAYIPNSFT